MISSCDPLLSRNIFPPPQQYIVFSYSWFSQLQRPALLKTAESAEAPLALTCSVLDEKQAMQSTEATQGGSEGVGEGERSDRCKEGGREGGGQGGMLEYRAATNRRKCGQRHIVSL